MFSRKKVKQDTRHGAHRQPGRNAVRGEADVTRTSVTGCTERGEQPDGAHLVVTHCHGKNLHYVTARRMTVFQNKL